MLCTSKNSVLRVPGKSLRKCVVSCTTRMLSSPYCSSGLWVSISATSIRSAPAIISRNSSAQAARSAASSVAISAEALAGRDVVAGTDVGVAEAISSAAGEVSVATGATLRSAAFGGASGGTSRWRTTPSLLAASVNCPSP